MEVSQGPNWGFSANLVGRLENWISPLSCPDMFHSALAAEHVSVTVALDLHSIVTEFQPPLPHHLIEVFRDFTYLSGKMSC
jgi:hypothetical protein